MRICGRTGDLAHGLRFLVCLKLQQTCTLSRTPVAACTDRVKLLFSNTGLESTFRGRPIHLPDAAWSPSMELVGNMSALTSVLDLFRGPMYVGVPGDNGTAWFSERCSLFVLEADRRRCDATQHYVYCSVHKTSAGMCASHCTVALLLSGFHGGNAIDYAPGPVSGCLDDIGLKESGCCTL